MRAPTATDFFMVLEWVSEKNLVDRISPEARSIGTGIIMQ